MANISDAFGTTFFDFSEVDWSQEKQIDFIEKLNDLIGKYYYCWSLNSIDYVSKNGITTSNCGSGRWSMFNTFESYQYDVGLKRFVKLFLKEEETVSLKITYNDYEPGCEFLVEGSVIKLTLNKNNIDFECIDEGEFFEVFDKEDLKRIMLYDDDYFDNEEEEEE